MYAAFGDGDLPALSGFRAGGVVFSGLEELAGGCWIDCAGRFCDTALEYDIAMILVPRAALDFEKTR